MRLSFVLALAISVASGLGVAACGTEPVGVESCRTIEEKRCELAPVCGTVSDVPACKRYYRDQCLHGLTVDADPGKPVVDKCVTALNAVGACAKSDPEGICAGVAAVGGTTACGAIQKPELLTDCAWLVPLVPTTGAAGSAGSAGASGAAGTAGAAGGT